MEDRIKEITKELAYLRAQLGQVARCVRYGHEYVPEGFKCYSPKFGVGGFDITFMCRHCGSIKRRQLLPSRDKKLCRAIELLCSEGLIKLYGDCENEDIHPYVGLPSIDWLSDKANSACPSGTCKP